jgi:PAS domain S-box-containing protein
MMADTLHVLYVDDEPDLLDISKMFLEESGDFSVTTIVSAPDALELLNKEQFDVVISDYQMPGMDGIQFLVEVRANFGPIPFILFTGKGREEVVIQAINSGADFYLQKGGEPGAQYAELSNKIRYAVTRTRAEKALSESQKRTAEIIEFLPDATFAISTDGVVIAWNRAMEVMTGVVKDEVLNKGNFEYSLPFYQERRPILIDLVLNPDDTAAGKYPFIQKVGDRIISEISIPHFNDGRGAHLWFTASPLYDSKGNISGAIESIRDITDLKRAEVDLRESEIRYRHVVEDQTEFICRFFPDGTYVFVNEAYCRYFGLNKEEIIGTRFQPNIHPDDRARVTRLIASLTPEHPFGTIDQRTIMPDGSTRWQRWVDRAIFHPDGSIKEYQSVGRDITATKQDEEALRESEERFRTLLECVPSVAVQGYRPDYTVVYWNEANTRIYGYSAEEAIGRDIRDLLVPIPARDEVTKAIARMAETGIPEPSGELEMLHKDGSLVPVFSSHAVVKIPGRSTIQFCIDVDLSERKRAENGIRESEERFRTIIHSMQFGIVIIDEQTHKILDANAKALEMIGGRHDVVVGSLCHRFICPAESGRCPVTNLIQNVDSSERVLLNRRGEKIPILKSVIKTALGGKEVLIESFIDITERKRAEESLQESESFNRNLIENLPDYVGVSGSDGKILFMNSPATNALGYTLEEMIGTSVLSYVAEEFRGEVIARMAARYIGGVVPPYEIDVLSRDGRRISVIVKGTQIQYRDTTAHLLVLTDITQRKRAEWALRDSEEKFKTLFESANDAIFIMDSKVFLDCNRSALAVFGCSWDQIIGHSPVEFSPVIQPDGRLSADKAKEKIDAAMSGEPQSFEWVHLHHDRTPIYAEVTLNRVLLGNVWHLQAAVRDISARKKNESQTVLLSELKEKLLATRSLKEQIKLVCDSCITIFDADFARIWLIKEGDLCELGCKHASVTDGHEVCRNRSQCLHLMVSSGRYTHIDGGHQRFPFGRYKIGRIASGEDSSFITNDVSHDPRIHDHAWAESLGLVSFAGFRLLSLDERSVGVLALFKTCAILPSEEKLLVDLANTLSQAIISGMAEEALRSKNEELRANLDELTRHELALKESEENYRSLTEQVHDGIYIYHGDHFLFVNTHVSKITGYSSEELLSMPFIDLVHPEDRAYIWGIAERRWREESGPEQFECRIIRRDGMVRHVEVIVSTIRYRGGYATVGAARDVTERKQAEVALWQANKKLNLLSSITRHDINNQLTVLQGYLKLLEDTQPDYTCNEYFSKVSTVVQRISAMIRFTKEYESLGVTTPAWQDARTVVAAAAKDVLIRKVVVKNDLPADMEVFTDQLITKVFYNLMDNAVRYGGKIKTIRFFVEERDGDHVVVCEDDGEGIADDEKEKIFERGVGKNTGLGLFLSREILSITGISIKETGEPGKGARFEIVVPKGAYRIERASRTGD